MDAQLLTVAVTCTLAAVVIAVLSYFARRFIHEQEEKDKQSMDDAQSSRDPVKASKPISNLKKAPTNHSRFEQGKVAEYSHKWLASNLKGHSRPVLDMDFSCNGKYLVSTSDDGTMIVWHSKDLTQRDHKISRGQVDLEHVDLLCVAPDSKSMLVHLARQNELGVYKLVRRDPAHHALRFDRVDTIVFKNEHSIDIAHIGFACNGHFLMSASADNNLIVYNLHMDILHQLDTKQNGLYCALVSPCGRFVAASGFTPDVKVWDVNFDRTGTFKSVNKAFDLKGHNSGVQSFAFSQDSTRMVTASKDASWRFWDTDIRYAQGEEPVKLFGGEWELLKGTAPEKVRTALAADAHSFAISVSRCVRLYQVPISTKVDTVPYEQIDDVFSAHSVSRLRFSVDSQLLCAAGDKHIRVFHNVAGYRALIDTLLKQSAKPQGDAHKRRLHEQIAGLEEKLKGLGVTDE